MSTKADRKKAAKETDPNTTSDSQNDGGAAPASAPQTNVTVSEERIEQLERMLAALQSALAANAPSSQSATTTASASNSSAAMSSAASPLSATTTTTTTTTNPAVTLPAALDDRAQLPTHPTTKLAGGAVKPDDYALWRASVTKTIEAIPRYKPLLLNNVEKGWEEFRRINAKYEQAQEYLQEKYLDTQRALWNYLTDCVNVHTSTLLIGEMKADSSNNLSETLNFIKIDTDFYQNCSKLMRRIDERYMRPSNWRIVDLLVEQESLHYQSNQDPALFFESYFKLQRQIMILVPKYKIQEEFVQAYQIITKLPKECEVIRNQFLNAEQQPDLKTLESVMMNWFQMERATKKAQDAFINKSNSKPPGGFRFRSSAQSTATAASAAETAQSAAEGGQQHVDRLGRPKQCFGCGKNDHDFKNCPEPDAARARGERTFKLKCLPSALKQRGWQEEIILAAIEPAMTVRATPIIEHYSTPETACAATSTTSSDGVFVPQRHHAIMDSGATSHFTGRNDMLENVEKIEPVRVTTIVGTREVSEVGTMRLSDRVRLERVKHLPNSTFSLISTAQICDADRDVVYTKDAAYVLEDGVLDKSLLKNEAKLTVPRQGKLWACEVEARTPRDDSTGTEDAQALAGVEAEYRANDAHEIVGAVHEFAAQADDEEEIAYDSDPDSDFIPIPALAPAEEIEIESDSESEPSACISTQTDRSNGIAELHAKLGHASASKLRAISDERELGFKDADIEHVVQTCGVCIRAKSKRAPVHALNTNPIRVAQEVMDCWHVDLSGPYSYVDKRKRFRLPSMMGHAFNLLLVDEKSRHVMVSSLKRKSDAPARIIEFIKLKQNAMKKKLVRLHCDGGGEFLNDELTSFLRENGTELTVAPPGTPEYNGLAERLNRTLRELVACMLLHSGAPQYLWNFAYLHAAYIYNRMPLKKLEYKAPIKLMQPDLTRCNLDKLHAFGCDAYVHLEEGMRGKLQARAQEGAFIGMSAEHDTYVILLRDSLTTVVSRNVKFIDERFEHLRVAIKPIQQLAEANSTIADKEYEVEAIVGYDDKTKQYEVRWRGYADTTWEPEHNLKRCKPAIKEFRRRMRRELSNREVVNAIVTLETFFKSSKPNADFSRSDSNSHEQRDFAAVSFEIANDIIMMMDDDPKTYREALQRPDRDKWDAAIQDEYKSWKKNAVSEEAILPEGRKAIDTKLVFKTKRDALMRILRYKVRGVARGFKQIEGVDYFETFSPTVGMKPIKLLFALAAKYGWEIKQMDFETAFLNALLEEEIYIKPPPGYVMENPACTVLRLRKALYGLKQASRGWWKTLDAFLRSLGYQRSDIDECLYFKDVNGKRIYLAVYVDDILIVYPKEIESAWLADKAKIAAEFAIQDLDECQWILNMEVTRDRERGTITISQQSYLERVLKRFNMQDCTPVHTPYNSDDLTMPPNNNLFKSDALNEKDHEEYRSIVGSLLYAANITRIDLSYIVGVLARYVSKPLDYHLDAARHVLRYVRGSVDVKLTLGAAPSSISRSSKKNSSTSTSSLVVYTDSNWAGEKVDRKSTGGFIVVFDGRPVTWQSKKQSVIALSSTEAEYYALGEATREALFLRQWMRAYAPDSVAVNSQSSPSPAPTPILIKCDNMGAIEIADHATNHARTKHIDVQHFFVREHVRAGEITLEHVRTARQLADILTKPMRKERFAQLKTMLYEPETSEEQERIRTSASEDENESESKLEERALSVIEALREELMTEEGWFGRLVKCKE